MKRFTCGMTWLVLGWCAAHAQYSAYLPEPGQFLVTPVYTYQQYDRFWMGKTKVSLDPDEVEQHTGLVDVEYGIVRDLAVDVSAGYTATSTKAFPPGGVDKDDDGLADTRIGVRYRFLDETRVNCPFAPTLALRAGAIIEGTYDENTPFAAGDGASGAEGSLLFGKAIGATGFGLFGDIGYRYRNQHVPEDIFGSIGIYQTIKFATLSFAYRHVQALSGGDIDDPDFGTRFGFPQLEEINQAIEVGLGISDKGGRYYQFFYARTIDGRNTGEKNIFGFSATFPFGGH